MRPEALDPLQVQALRARSPAERLRMTMGLNQAAHELARAGVQHRDREDGIDQAILETTRPGADPDRALSELIGWVDAFEDVGPPFMLAGRLAVSVHGAPRTAWRIDVLVPDQLQEDRSLRSMLAGRSTVEAHAGARCAGASFSATRPGGLPLRVRSVEADPIHDRALGRRVRVEIDGRSVPFIGPEGLILDRLARSTDDEPGRFSAALAVAQVQGYDLDLAYLRGHCAPHRVCDLVDEIAEAIGQTDG